TLNLSPFANIFKYTFTEEVRDRAEIKRLLRRYEALETAKLEKYLSFLATTGSTTPFIGLFGTVWGITNAFRGIGAAGSASLAVVAPGIAEALITTAAGLAAAIPAVIAYNYYLSRARQAIIEMEDFAEELLDFFSQGAK
ncbi:MAG: MotA/TolQ/ExbB proton channel family protein, partial [Thermodesulfovibrionales bacterium]